MPSRLFIIIFLPEPSNCAQGQEHPKISGAVWEAFARSPCQPQREYYISFTSWGLRRRIFHFLIFLFCSAALPRKQKQLLLLTAAFVLFPINISSLPLRSNLSLPVSPSWEATLRLFSRILLCAFFFLLFRVILVKHCPVIFRNKWIWLP